MYLSLIAACLLATSGSLTAAEDCGQHEDGVLFHVGGRYQTGYFAFRYLSQVEAATQVTRRYIWCLTNLHDYHVTEFLWGSPARPDRYFQGFVIPGSSIPREETNSSMYASADRTLQFRRANRLFNESWGK
jgi:hypothetical protein